jgi:hypothetical protein
MPIRTSTALAAAVALLATTAATAIAAAPASASLGWQGAPQTAQPAIGSCTGQYYWHSIDFLPNDQDGWHGSTPFTPTFDLSQSTIDAKCPATIDFGDGSAAIAVDPKNLNPQHTYDKAGRYTVTLTLNLPDGIHTETSVVFAEGPAGQASVFRLAGSDRLDTAVKVSQDQWLAPNKYQTKGQADAVVLARGDQYPDALAGVPLAAYKRGPLLLTNPGALYAGAETEIERILPKGKTVYILGGPAAVNPAIDAKLVHDGYAVQRYSGNDRFGTAMAIAKQGMGDPKHIIVATGLDFPDALTAGPLAAGPNAIRQSPTDAYGQPAAIVLSAGSGFFDQATADYVRGKLNAGDCRAVTTVGGQGDAAVAKLGGACHLSLVGTDRYNTSYKAFKEFANIDWIGVATGLKFPDALSGGAFLANTADPLLLVNPLSLTDDAGRIFNGTHSQNGVADISVFGGSGAVSDHVVGQIQSAVQNGYYYVP